MKCTFKSIKPDGDVAHACDLVATSKIKHALIDACNAYWAATDTTYRWTVDPGGVCDTHAKTIMGLNEILEDGDFDRISGKPRERVR